MTTVVETARGAFLVEESGDPDGRALVFVAGLGDDHRSWSDVVPAFSCYRCLTFDNRGIGGSITSPGPYTVAQLAADAHAVTSALGLADLTVVGSSMGGAICQEWMLAHPDAIRRAVLTNTWAQSDAFCVLLFEHLITLADKGLATELAQFANLLSFSPEYLAGHPEADWADGSGFNLLGFAAAARACAGHDTLDRIHRIARPTLVLAGEQDILTRPELAEPLADRLPRGELATIDAGHMTFQEDPAGWVAIVTDWLSRTPG
ncbi:MAG: alpha/beta fold hydrolase [Mycobacterium sp.]|nr:alpha/beta fold hydrolase [Mycobacterium sp.]